ncbi:MAG TPA: polyprenyl diphosphate synthase, partial [Niabella sp.]|nr:polyprenyl diphosphate synthase [Niabella sp.]
VGMLPASAQEELNEALELTIKNTGLNLIMALSYSGRWDLENAVRKIAQKAKEGLLQPQDITGEVLKQNLSTARFPDPELMIRTSGEYRISNFLLYELAYSELYFTEVRWPDFRKNNLYEAILDFQNRERRFGKTSVQVQK